MRIGASGSNGLKAAPDCDRDRERDERDGDRDRERDNPDRDPDNREAHLVVLENGPGQDGAASWDRRGRE
jgi:hypothetical protein